MVYFFHICYNSIISLYIITCHYMLFYIIIHCSILSYIIIDCYMLLYIAIYYYILIYIVTLCINADLSAIKSERK